MPSGDRPARSLPRITGAWARCRALAAVVAGAGLTLGLAGCGGGRESAGTISIAESKQASANSGSPERGGAAGAPVDRAAAESDRGGGGRGGR